MLKISPNLQKRIISAGILAPIILYIVMTGGFLFSALVVVTTIVMSFEWVGMVSKPKADGSETNFNKWRNGGILYISIFALSLLYLRNMSGGTGAIFLMLSIVWATDIAAYFTGRTFKGPKIYPKISPNKTWSGLAGGTLGAVGVGFFASAFFDISLVTLLLICGVFAPISQAGDFFESWVKRKFGVKDSGDIIPGHGGLLDRIDGITTVAPIFAVLSIISGGSFL